jgi:2-polyprenyl-3-methyl-5-hydroxy-6-metoxy-1,4-benzoquinol methylase
VKLEVVFDALNGYQRSMAIKGAIELALFTHIADGATSAAEIAKRCLASERGVRILCDFLVVHRFLTKNGGNYGLSAETGVFLNQRSPAYLGSMATFLLNQTNIENFSDVAAVVRKGGTTRTEHGHQEPDSPIWVEFARSMAPMAAMEGHMIAPIVAEMGRPIKVLDIAAGHGLYGINIAMVNPQAEIFAADWKKVLEVALENARKAGVADRYHTLPGSAFEVDFGNGFDLVLLTNFLHHFDRPTNVKLLKKIRAALKQGGKVATLEFVPNDDRVSPPSAATFSFIMLGNTEGGDAYTFRELDAMFREAGFGESRMQDLPPTPQRLIVTS